MSEPNLISKSNTLYSIDSTNNNNDINNRETITTKNKKLITIGKCSKFYFYILGSTLFKLFSLFLLGFKKRDTGIFGFVPILYSYRSMQSIYTYLSYILFGTILHLCSKGEDNYNKQFRARALSLAYDKLMNQNKTRKNFLIILTCFSFVIYNEIQNVLYSFRYQNYDYWSFDILFTFLLMKKYFEVDVQKHHKCSIIFVTIICTLLLFIVSFLPNSITNGLNQYQFIKEQLGSYFYSIIFISIFLLLSLN